MSLDTWIYRHFTKELEDSNKDVYSLFTWKKVNVVLHNYSTGEVIYDKKELEFPADYTQSACDIIASKYFRKKGTGDDRNEEYSMKQLADRMVSFWVKALIEEGIITKEQQQIVYDELVYMMLSQMWAPNSPQWFNTGLELAYGITGTPQGHYYYDEEQKKVVLSKDAYTRTQGSACFIISVRDTLMGEKSLTDQLKTETLLFKFGSGVGTNWSPIRAVNETLSSGGKSSGLLSFLKVSDRNAGAIKSGGTTRRAAKMNMLDLDHPEILDFIRWKEKEEDKVLALQKMGYSTDIDGEAYETVSGQNANNSVRVPNDFMHHIGHEDALWKVTGRVDKKQDKTIPVKEIWDAIGEAAWRCGDPGVQYDDIINDWHTCPAGEDGELGAKHNRINASNPCSEYMFLDDTACNLASINIMKFYDPESGQFDLDAYLHAITIIQLVLEATIYQGQFPTKDIARKSFLFRTTGLGLTNMGMLFMIMGLPYDSDEARTVGAGMMSLLTGQSYLASSMMAEKVGPFEAYELNKPYMEQVMANHAYAAGVGTEVQLSYEPMKIDHAIFKDLKLEGMSQALHTVWNEAIENGKTHGYRNAQVSALAPTGTIAFAMDCATTSSEPFFSHVAYKKLVGGSFMEIINPAIPAALKKLGYEPDEIEDIIEYVMRTEEFDGYSQIVDGKIEGAPHLKDEHVAVFDTASRCGTGVRFISPEGHVKMMGALAPHVTGAISKTVNMPNESSVADILDIYELSWRLGVKSIAIYRDGCKVSQPLSATKDEYVRKELSDYTYQELMDMVRKKQLSQHPLRVKPSGIRKARVHEAAINGLKLYVTTSFYEDDRLGEVYVSCGRQGSLTKGLLDSLSTTISKMLQYGVPPEDIARNLRGQKYEPSGVVTGHPNIKFVDSISDLISKILDIEMGNYSFVQVKPEGYVETIHNPGTLVSEIPTEYSQADVLHGEVCPTCASPKMIRNGNCKVCTVCGTTTGCS